MSVSNRKISRAVYIAFACTLANAVRAHDTWLIPDPQTATAVSSTHREIALLLTTGAEFPALGTTTSPERLQRANLISNEASVPLLVGKSTETTLGLRGLTVASSVVMAVVQLKPKTIELAPDVVQLYLKELGGSLSISRRYQALGHWRESYSKNAKMWIRVGADAAPASMFKPINVPYELVPSSDPTRLKAGSKLEVCAYASGKPVAKAYLGMVAADGTKTMLWASAKGCANFTMRITSGFLMHGILITESELPELDWESHFASFTVLDATPKATSTASNSTL